MFSFCELTALPTPTTRPQGQQLPTVGHQLLVHSQRRTYSNPTTIGKYSLPKPHQSRFSQYTWNYNDQGTKNSVSNVEKSPKVVCGIVGGVGPMAGVKLHEKIIQFTPTNGTDQSHFCVHHVSQSQYIPDRTKFILSEQKTNVNGHRGEANDGSDLRSSSDITTNPAYGATQAVQNLIQSTPRYHTLLVGVPCNTFHAPEIWNVFEAGIETYVHGKTKTDFAVTLWSKHCIWWMKYALHSTRGL